MCVCSVNVSVWQFSLYIHSYIHPNVTVLHYFKMHLIIFYSFNGHIVMHTVEATPPRVSSYNNFVITVVLGKVHIVQCNKGI